MPKNSQKSSITFAVFAVLWMAGLLTGYYLFHKPITVPMVTAFIRLVWTIVPAVWIISLAGGLGYRLFRFEGLSNIESAFLQAALGLGIYSVIILITGLTIGYLHWILWILAVLPLIFLRRDILYWWKQWGQIRMLWPASDRFSCWVVGLVIILCLQSFFIEI